jgi:hypothetical protein
MLVIPHVFCLFSYFFFSKSTPEFWVCCFTSLPLVSLICHVSLHFITSSTLTFLPIQDLAIYIFKSTLTCNNYHHAFTDV